jgi:membrane-bound lytic murein transglycosylase B
MKAFKSIKIILFISLLLTNNSAIFAQATMPPKHHIIKNFIAKMVADYHFNNAKLAALFKKVHLNQRVIDLMNTPYEAKPWYLYKKHFIQAKRIQQGALFWRQHQHILATVARRTGVPAEYIVAIIGIESHYGKRQGHFPALEVLYTLSFHYPRRAPFFQNELKEYLLLCRDQNWDPLTIQGSYAAALGQAQFMPSSYRAYAKAYDGNKRINLFNHDADIIASVANYFYIHGWQRHQPIASKAIVTGNKYQQLPIQDRNSKISKPTMTLQKLQQFGVHSKPAYPVNYKATFMRFDLKKGNTYWLGYNNFYVITRYNTSKLYALAVYQLATSIKQQYQQQYPKK